VEAVKWYRKAAEQNHDMAQYGLGACYLKGHGVTKDEVEAVKWITLAAWQGDEEAKAAIPQIKNIVEGRQIAEGTLRAKDWLEKWKRLSTPSGSEP